ncbi:MAG: hypothetical protein CMJ46_06845 [Planctomyces sp.]|nr:hypothetical protein [Planctomyces sp.]
MRTVLYKIGGSLLSDATLRERLEAFLRTRDDEEFPILLIGGGSLVDEIREVRRNADVSEELCHWEALAAMGVNGAEFALGYPESTIVGYYNHLRKVLKQKKGRPFLCAWQLLERLESRYELELPHNWDVTSDSIAAWFTITQQFDELRLLKSIPPVSWEQLLRGETNGVDRAFKTYLPHLKRLSWVNFRTTEPAIHAYAECGADSL